MRTESRESAPLAPTREKGRGVSGLCELNQLLKRRAAGGLCLASFSEASVILSSIANCGDILLRALLDAARRLDLVPLAQTNVGVPQHKIVRKTQFS
jgi:hypothetical protein